MPWGRSPGCPSPGLQRGALDRRTPAWAGAPQATVTSPNPRLAGEGA